MTNKYKVLSCLVLLGPVAAMAQTTLGASNITFYGKIDLALDTTRFSSTPTLPGQTAHYLSDDISFWGIRGSESLGGNTRAYFKLESGFSPDTGALDSTTSLFDRESYIGYGADWGSVQLGNQYSPAVFLELRSDPFTRHAAGNGTTLMQAPPVTPSPVVSRGTYGAATAPNAVQYISPTLYGLVGKALYSFSEKPGSQNQPGRYAAGTLEYTNGPLFMGVGYENSTVAATKLAPSADGQLMQRTITLGGAYTFPIAKLFAYGMKNTLTGQPDVNGYMVGFNVPLSQFTIKTIYSSRQTDNTVGGRATFYALGLDYDLSKRTTLYSAVAHMNNETSANAAAPNNFGLWPSKKTYAPTGKPANGQSLSTLEFGIRHTF